MSTTFLDLILSDLHMAQKSYKNIESDLYKAGITEGRLMDCPSVWYTLSVDELVAIWLSPHVDKKANKIPISLETYLRPRTEIKDEIYERIGKKRALKNKSVDDWVKIILDQPVWDARTKHLLRSRLRFCGLIDEPKIASLLQRPVEGKKRATKRKYDGYTAEDSLRWIRAKIEAREITNIKELMAHAEGRIHALFLRSKGVYKPFNVAVGWKIVKVEISDYTNRELLELFSKGKMMPANIRAHVFKRIKAIASDHDQARRILNIISSFIYGGEHENRIIKMKENEIKAILTFAEIKTAEDCEEFMPNLYKALLRRKYVEEKFFEVWFPMEYEKRKKKNSA